ncbi:restriction endonuclease subunit S [Oscillibacter valericigenes]|nr:restriction endonuclease subunit S [Oscillibacter valericigenes]
MSEWKSISLGQLSKEKKIEIRTGPFGSQLHQSDYIDDGTPVVMPKDIVDWNICTDTIARTSSEMVEKLRIHQLRTGDIVYGRRGDIGRHAFVSEHEEGWLCGTGCIRLRLLNNAPIIPRFLSFFLRLPNTINSIYNQAVGSTMPNLNTGIIENIVVNYPEVDTQKKIVGALCTYDDLIENNNRRIAILEDMAQKLYREWFVHFRFPGHENVKMVESEMGLIPADWYSYCVSDIARFIKGKKTSDITNEQQAGYVKNILLDAIASGEYKFVNPQKMVLVEPNDIVMVMDGASSGKVFSGECGAVGSTLAKISTPDEYRFVLLMYLASHEPSIMDNNTGSAIPHANKDFVNMMRLTIPSDGLLTRFNNIIGEYMYEKQLLRNKNLNLRRTRDLLLPRLISGDIDVSELDIPIKEG